MGANRVGLGAVEGNDLGGRVSPEIPRVGGVRFGYTDIRQVYLGEIIIVH